MALYILQPGLEPLGQFDCLDADIASILGGEVAVLDEISRTNSTTEKAAADVLDGYIADQVDNNSGTATRVVARIADGYSTTFLDATKGNTRVEPRRLFYLMDDGVAGYGPRLGSLIGNPVGLATTVSGSVSLGFSSIYGSGKVTLWDKRGLYAVSSDALSVLLDPSSGNINDTPLPGDLLYREHNTGRLTTVSTTGDKIAMFMELTSNRSLVTTPTKLVGAAEAFDRMVIQYLGPSANV